MESLGLERERTGLRRDQLDVAREGIGLDKERVELKGDDLGLDREKIGLAKEDIGVQREGLEQKRDIVDNEGRRQKILRDRATRKSMGNAVSSTVGGNTLSSSTINHIASDAMLDEALDHARRIEQHEGIDLQEKRLNIQDRSLDVDARRVDLREAGLDVDLRDLALAERGIDIQEAGVGIDERAIDISEGRVGLQRQRLGVRGRGLDLQEQALGLESRGIDLQESGLDLQGRRIGAYQDRATDAHSLASSRLGENYATLSTRTQYLYDREAERIEWERAVSKETTDLRAELTKIQGYINANHVAEGGAIQASQFNAAARQQEAQATAYGVQAVSTIISGVDTITRNIAPVATGG